MGSLQEYISKKPIVVNMQKVKLGGNSPFQFPKIDESNNFSGSAGSECHLHCGLKMHARFTDFFLSSLVGQ